MDSTTPSPRSSQRTRALLHPVAASTPRVSCVAPRGTFYAFPKLDIPEDDKTFVTDLLRSKQVLLVHGSGFGQKPGTRHARIVFLPDEVALARAYGAMAQFIRSRY